MRVLGVTAAVLAAMIAVGTAQQKGKGAPKAPAAADPCANAMTQTEMTDCARRGLERQNATLATVYQALLKDLDADHKPILDKAQTAWEAYRAAQCELQASENLGGSIYPMEVNDCQAAMAGERTAALRKLRKDLTDFIAK